MHAALAGCRQRALWPQRGLHRVIQAAPRMLGTIELFCAKLARACMRVRSPRRYVTKQCIAASAP